MLRLYHADGHSNAHGQPTRLREDAACCVSTSPHQIEALFRALGER